MFTATVTAENAELISAELQQRGCKIISCTLSPMGVLTEITALPKPGTGNLYYLGLAHGMDTGIRRFTEVSNV